MNTLEPHFAFFGLVLSGLLLTAVGIRCGTNEDANERNLFWLVASFLVTLMGALQLMVAFVMLWVALGGLK